MNTINQLNQAGILSDQDTITLKELATGSDNILIIGSDKQMNENLLRAVVEQRVNFNGGWYFKEWSDSDVRNLVPDFTGINSNKIESYEAARELVRAMTNTPIIIDEIKTPAMATFFLECCVGLRDRVTATYSVNGSIQSFLNSFSQLTKPNIAMDHPNPNLVLEMHVEKVISNITVLIVCNNENGVHKVSIVDRRNN